MKDLIKKLGLLQETIATPPARRVDHGVIIRSRLNESFQNASDGDVVPVGQFVMAGKSTQDAKEYLYIGMAGTRPALAILSDEDPSVASKETTVVALDKAHQIVKIGTMRVSSTVGTQIERLVTRVKRTTETTRGRPHIEKIEVINGTAGGVSEAASIKASMKKMLVDMEGDVRKAVAGLGKVDKVSVWGGGAGDSGYPSMDVSGSFVAPDVDALVKEFPEAGVARDPWGGSTSDTLAGGNLTMHGINVRVSEWPEGKLMTSIAFGVPTGTGVISGEPIAKVVSDDDDVDIDTLKKTIRGWLTKLAKLKSGRPLTGEEIQQKLLAKVDAGVRANLLAKGNVYSAVRNVASVFEAAGVTDEPRLTSLDFTKPVATTRYGSTWWASTATAVVEAGTARFTLQSTVNMFLESKGGAYAARSTWAYWTLAYDGKTTSGTVETQSRDSEKATLTATLKSAFVIDLYSFAAVVDKVTAAYASGSLTAEQLEIVADVKSMVREPWLPGNKRIKVGPKGRMALVVVVARYDQYGSRGETKDEKFFVKRLGMLGFERSTEKLSLYAYQGDTEMYFGGDDKKTQVWAHPNGLRAVTGTASEGGYEETNGYGEKYTSERYEFVICVLVEPSGVRTEEVIWKA